MMKDELKKKINQTLGFIKNNYWPLVIIGLPVFVILEIIGVSLTNMYLDNEDAFSALLTIIVQFFINGFVVLLFIYLINSVHTKTSFSLNDVINFVLKSIFPVSLAMWAIKLVTTLGLILLIFPGVYILARIAIAPFLISMDGVKLADAFRLSFKYSEKQSLLMALAILILSIPVAIAIIMRLFVEVQLAMSVFNIIINLSYVIEYVLIYFFYLEIRPMMVFLQNEHFSN